MVDPEYFEQAVAIKVLRGASAHNREVISSLNNVRILAVFLLPLQPIHFIATSCFGEEMAESASSERLRVLRSQL